MGTGPRLVGELADRSPEEDAGRTRSVAPPPLSAWVSPIRSGEASERMQRDVEVKGSSFGSDPVVHEMGLLNI
jgi:hypothetical protein